MNHPNSYFIFCKTCLKAHFPHPIPFLRLLPLHPLCWPPVTVWFTFLPPLSTVLPLPLSLGPFREMKVGTITIITYIIYKLNKQDQVQADQYMKQRLSCMSRLLCWRDQGFLLYLCRITSSHLLHSYHVLSKHFTCITLKILLSGRKTAMIGRKNLES